MRRSQRGAALILVLWVIALASTLLGSLAVSVQLQQKQALWQRHQTRAALAAEAGLTRAVAGLLERGPRRWRPDGELHRLTFDDSELAVRVRSERGKLDLNAAPASDVRRLLNACGAGERAAADTVAALMRRRDRQPLRLLEAFRSLPGMTYARYRCVRPLITVWSGMPRPDPALAPPALVRALDLPRVEGAAARAGQILTVDVRATLAGGFRSHLAVTLLLRPSSAGTQPYRVLRWQE